MAGTATPSGNIFKDSTALVFDGFNEARSWADTWMQRLNESIQDLDTIIVEPVAIGVTYDTGTFAPSFTRPTRPTEPTFPEVSLVTPDVPVLDPVLMRELGDAPVEPDLTPYLAVAMPSTPTDPVPSAPAVDTSLEEIEYPTLGELLRPDLPTFYDVVLPVAEEIVLPEFDGQRPTINIELPEDGQLDWQEEAYVSDLEQPIKAALLNMMQGGTGLPLAIEAAIFDRGRAREDRLSRRAIAEIESDMASRGWGDEPTGVFAARVKEVHLDNREKTSTFNRDMSIERFKEAIESMKFSITSGIGYEQTLINLTMSINERALKAAMFVREYSVNRVNALIAYANLQQMAYKTDADVWRTRIEGEMQKLEKFRTEVEAQSLISGLNKDLVQLYSAQWEAVRTEIQAYSAQVEAANGRGQRNLQRLEAGKLLLQRYDSQVTAWGKRWDGYKSQVDAALGRGKFAESLANIFATQMQGYKTRGEAFFQEGQFALSRNQQTISLFDAQLRRSDQDLRAQMAELDAVIKQWEGRVSMYQADGSIAQAESAAFDRSAQLKAEIERNRTAVAVSVMQAQVQQALGIAGILVEQVKAKAQALSNLMAASQAGVHLGATIGASGSGSYNHSRSANWSGEAPDFTGTEVFY